ncbi:MAG: squalene/phytoene synthase family protein [Chthoniobacterales bacterium]|nr:squalene/phytoene synthase family protein [Chthoniobacterales bacterium]
MADPITSQRSPTAHEITRASKSNLALAFVSLGRERRRDITVFYAFCRLIDDIADDPVLAPEEKNFRLTTWRAALTAPAPNESPLAAQVRGLIQKYSVTPAMLGEIIDGVEMDLRISRYETFAGLREYCYRVASAVGLVSIEIFGYRNPSCREYAIELGLALQITNILRDVSKDLASGRIYLPREDLARFDYAESDLQVHLYDERFVRLMEFEAARAEKYFARAAALLPREDRRSMIGAEIMASIYHALLRQMARDRFRVFARSYGLSKLAKILHVTRRLLLAG